MLRTAESAHLRLLVTFSLGQVCKIGGMLSRKEPLGSEFRRHFKPRIRDYQQKVWIKLAQKDRIHLERDNKVLTSPFLNPIGTSMEPENRIINWRE